LLATRDDIGRAISKAEGTKLLEAWGLNRSRSLLPAVTLALNTCMRYSEIRLLKWHQVYFVSRALTVGKSNSDAGTGRVIPVNTRAWAVLEFWGSNLPDRTPAHYVFPSERYGAAADKFEACAYRTDPARPIGRWKEVWEKARTRAGVQCRFHDLRHTVLIPLQQPPVFENVTAGCMPGLVEVELQIRPAERRAVENRLDHSDRIDLHKLGECGAPRVDLGEHAFRQQVHVLASSRSMRWSAGVLTSFGTFFPSAFSITSPRVVIDLLPPDM
jgi:integrase